MTRIEAPQDQRPYVRVALDLPTNPKIMGLDNPAEAIGAYVASLCLSSQSMGDGQFSVVAVRRLTGVCEATAMALAEQGLWHLPGHACDRCEQPRSGHAVIHDYLRHQRSADDVRTLSDKRRASGRKGAQSRWQDARGTDPKPDQDPSVMASAMASAMADAEQVGQQTDGNVMAEQSRAEQSRELPTEVPLDGPPASPPEPSAATKRGTRLTEDFEPDAELIAWVEDRYPALDWRLETERFNNYWQARSGQGATKTDWEKTWKNWMLKAGKDLANSSGHGRSRNGTTPYQGPRHPRTVSYDALFGTSNGGQP